MVGAMTDDARTAHRIEEADEEHAVEVGATPAQVWSLIADPTRTPEWSGVVHKVEWLGDGSARPGGRFRGHNRFNGFRWVRECEITEAREPEVFAFSTFGRDGREQTRWRYTLVPLADGRRTKVTLAYQVVTLPRWVAFLQRVPGAAGTSARQATANMTSSLERIASIAASR